VDTNTFLGHNDAHSKTVYTTKTGTNVTESVPLLTKTMDTTPARADVNTHGSFGTQHLDDGREGKGRTAVDLLQNNHRSQRKIENKS